MGWNHQPGDPDYFQPEKSPQNSSNLSTIILVQVTRSFTQGDLRWPSSLTAKHILTPKQTACFFNKMGRFDGWWNQVVLMVEIW